MRLIITLLLLALMGMPANAEMGTASPGDLFLEVAGVQADDALRAKVEAFISLEGMTPRIIQMMSPELAARYVNHLSADLPIHYQPLLSDEATDFGNLDPEALKQLLVTRTEGNAMPSLLIDFERDLIYYDEAWPVAEDVCRAEHSGALTPEIKAEILNVLSDIPFSDWQSDYPGEIDAGVSLLALSDGVSLCRFTAAGMSDAPESFTDAIFNLLSIGANAF